MKRKPEIEQRAKVYGDGETEDADRAAQCPEPVNRDAVEVRPGKKIFWDGLTQTIINVGERTITLSGVDHCVVDFPIKTFKECVRDGDIGRTSTSNVVEPHPEAARRLLGASPRSLREATRKAALVQGYLRGDRRPANVPESTFRGWVKAYRAAVETYGNGIFGLIAKRNRRNVHALVG
jgi:hypothetical protein